MSWSLLDGRSTELRMRRRAKRGPGSRRRMFEQVEPRCMLAAAAANLAADEAAAGDSIDAFGLDLYAQLQSETGGNLFVSPFSIAAALDMTYAGARGETAQQMASVLHLGADPGAVESDFGELLNDLNGAGQSGGYLLSVADALWAQQGLALLPEFLNVVQADFDSGLKQVDFIADAEAARKTINDWVAQQTNGKIQNLLQEGVLDRWTKLVLTNAIYFKGSWATSFDPNETADAPFTLASGSQTSASTMHQTGELRYMQSDGYQVLELPYANGRLAMDVLLPTQSGLAGLDSDQLPADLNGWLKGLGTREVEVSLPKFQMTTQFQLNAPLGSLGMTDAFAPDADFSGITASGPLNISAVVHKAFISVDEAGTEAAAATGVGVAHVTVVTIDPRPPVVFDADHPFLFLIRDTQSGSVLFMGQVENPNQQGSDSSAPVITHAPGEQHPVVPDPVVPDPIVQDPPIWQAKLAPVSSDPNPPLTGSNPAAPVTGAALSPNEQWLDAVYGELLGRAAEPAALTYWSAQVDGGGSRAGVVSEIESSAEFRRVEIEGLYQSYLGRAADPAGLDYFSNQLAAGGSLEQVAAALAGSAEFFQLHGGSDGAMIDALFTTALGRSVDAAGLAYFEQALAAGATRQQIAAQVLASNEYQQHLAGVLWSQFSNQPADADGVAQLAAHLHSGVSDLQAIDEIVSSDEFFAQATR